MVYRAVGEAGTNLIRTDYTAVSRALIFEGLQLVADGQSRADYAARVAGIVERIIGTDCTGTELNAVNRSAIVEFEVGIGHSGLHFALVIGAGINLILIYEVLSGIFIFYGVLFRTCNLLCNVSKRNAGCLFVIPETIIFGSINAVAGFFTIIGGRLRAVSHKNLTIVGEQVVDECKDCRKFFGFTVDSRIGNGEAGILNRAPRFGETHYLSAVEIAVIAVVSSAVVIFGNGGNYGSEIVIFGNIVLVGPVTYTHRCETAVCSLSLNVVEYHKGLYFRAIFAYRIVAYGTVTRALTGVYKAFFNECAHSVESVVGGFVETRILNGVVAVYISVFIAEGKAALAIEFAD